MIKKATFPRSQYQEATVRSFNKPLLLGTGFLTSLIMSGGFFVNLFWLLDQKPSKKPL
jgi:hypothetical protein